MLSDDSGLLFPKPRKVKRRQRHKKSILNTEKHVCFLCAHLYGDYSYKYTEEHHVLYGSGQRRSSEEEGLKVYLCMKHHKEGAESAHGCRETRELLCRLAQQQYEKTHSREEWCEKFRKNYLEDTDNGYERESNTCD